MDNDLLEWAELILAAVLEKRDAQPLVALALRAGVDLDVLQHCLNMTLDGVRDHLMGAAAILGWLARPTTDTAERRLSAEDVAALEDLGIDPM
jgi:hypothetical protein